ncbi:TPA: hypothetical protein I7726_22935 [Vibrio vulnificus]|nr:hypothetical protein D8T43_21380 [Vibrio vulnificus]HAS8452792.1 hypothetical protein [Vibrio vulnificus]
MTAWIQAQQQFATAVHIRKPILIIMETIYLVVMGVRATHQIVIWNRTPVLGLIVIIVKMALMFQGIQGVVRFQDILVIQVLRLARAAIM